MALMYQPAFQGQEDPRVGQIDEVATVILLKLRVMMRRAQKDRPRHRQELREMLQDYVNRVMTLADTLDH
jgi:hypothetical protein